MTNEDKEIRKYIVTLTFNVDLNEKTHPKYWDWNDLVGEDFEDITVFDVTDNPVERVQMTQDGPKKF